MASCLMETAASSALSLSNGSLHSNFLTAKVHHKQLIGLNKVAGRVTLRARKRTTVTQAKLGGKFRFFLNINDEISASSKRIL